MTAVEYRELRGLADDERRAWVRARFPEGVTQSWWRGMALSAELDVSPLRGHPTERCRENFEFAVSLLELAHDERGMSPCVVAYWSLRFAASALRYQPPIEGLPETMTPDGAARLALARIPLSRDEVSAAAGRNREDLRQGGVRFFAVGDDISNPRNQENEVRWLVHEIEGVLDALEQIADRITDEQVSQKAHAWLALRPEL